MTATVISATGSRYVIQIPLLPDLTTAADRSSVQVQAASTSALEWERERVRRADLIERELLAKSFAARVASRPGVRQVRLIAVEPDLCVGVVVDDLDMERELALHASFIELATVLSDPATGDLAVYVAGDESLPDGEILA